MRASAVVLCLLALGACGGSRGAAGPSDLAGEGGLDAAAPLPDAASELTTTRDAQAEAPAAEVEQRDAIPMLEDAMLAAPCGVRGAKCPTYVGSSVWMRGSQEELSGSMGPDGAIYIGGSVDNTFDFDPTQGVDTEGTDGQSSGFLMKLSPTGAYASTFTLAGDTVGVQVAIAAPAVTVTASFVPGSFDGTVDLDPGPGVHTAESMATRGGTFISKFDAAGKFVWGQVLVSSDSGLVYWGAPVALPDGGVVLTGTYVGPSDLAPGPAVLSPASESGAFVTRLDASGNQLWVRTLGCDGFASPSMSAALDSGGVLWLSGGVSDTSCAFDQGGPAGPAPHGFYVASMTLDGKIRTYGTVMGSDSLIGPPLVASDGSIYLAGNIGTSGPDAHGPIDVDPSSGVSNRNVPDTGLDFVMKLDHDGKLVWLQPIDFELASFASVALAPDDGLILAGGLTSSPASMLILRLDSGGNEVWRLLSGGTGTFPDAVLVNATGFFVLGEQSGSGDLDPSTGVDTQNGSIWFLSKYTF